MATHSSTLAWKIPWTEGPGGLQSIGSLGVEHDWATSLYFFHFHALEMEMATHSSVLAWRIPGTGEPGGLLSMGSHRVRHNWSNSAAAAEVISYDTDTCLFLCPLLHLEWSSLLSLLWPALALFPPSLWLRNIAVHVSHHLYQFNCASTISLIPSLVYCTLWGQNHRVTHFKKYFGYIPDPTPVQTWDTSLLRLQGWDSSPN